MQIKLIQFVFQSTASMRVFSVFYVSLGTHFLVFSSIYDASFLSFCPQEPEMPFEWFRKILQVSPAYNIWNFPSIINSLRVFENNKIKIFI